MQNLYTVYTSNELEGIKMSVSTKINHVHCISYSSCKKWTVHIVLEDVDVDAHARCLGTRCPTLNCCVVLEDVRELDAPVWAVCVMLEDVRELNTPLWTVCVMLEDVWELDAPVWTVCVVSGNSTSQFELCVLLGDVWELDATVWTVCLARRCRGTQHPSLNCVSC